MIRALLTMGILALLLQQAPLRLPQGSLQIDVPALIFAPKPKVATLHGRIRTVQTGLPVAGLPVGLIANTYTDDGWLTPVRVERTQTGEDGSYTLNVPTAGRYFISTGAITADAQIFVPTYYPGAAEMADAAFIDIEEGKSVTGLDFEVSPGAKVSVRGKLIDGLGRRFPHWDWVWLTPRDPMGAVIGEMPQRGYRMRSRYENAGEYAINDVPPGRYYLMSYRFDEISRRAETMMPIVVGGEDLAVDVVSEESFELNGRIQFDGGRFSLFASGNGRGPIISIVARSLTGSPLDTPNATIHPSGTFSFLPLPAGSYRVSVLDVPPPFYVKSVRLGVSWDVLEKGITLPRQGTDSMVVVLGSNGGRLEGAVENGPASVVLIPEGKPILRSDLYKRVETESDGRFLIEGVAPGRYRVYAWKSSLEREYFAVDFMKAYAGAGTVLEMSTAGSVTVSLRRLN